MARAGAQAAAEEAAGIKRMSAFGAIADVGHCIAPMNHDAIDPTADIGRIKIPRCSNPGRLMRKQDSEQFRFAPRT